MKKYLFEILIVAFFILSRLPSLGHDNFTTDTWKWKSRSYDFGTGVFQLDFQKTLQKYHPGVTLMWIGTAGVKINNLYSNVVSGSDPVDNDVASVFQLDLIQKILLVFVVAVSLAFALYPIRILFGKTTALIMALLISFEPYFLALTRVFHLEGLLSIFMFSSVVWLFWFLGERGYRKLIVSAGFAGLAILTKTTALFLLPFSFLMLTVWGLSGEGLTEKLAGIISKKAALAVFIKRVFVDFSVWIFSALLTVFILWPALWVDLVGVLQAIYKGVAVVGIEREHIQFYFGRLVEDPGISFYPVVFVFKVSLILLFGLLGQVFVFRKNAEYKKQIILYLLVYSLLYVLAISFPSKKLDRYIVPAVVSLSALSSFFYVWVWEKIKAFFAVKLLFMVVMLIASIYYLHPDYLSYYNPLLGGLTKGIGVLEPKWLIGEREIIEYFKKVQAEGSYVKTYNSSIERLIDSNQTDNVLIVAFQEKYYTQIWPFFREIGAWAVIEDLTGQSRYAKYFVYPVWDDVSSQEKRFKLEYSDSIYVRGAEIYRVYKLI